VAVLTRFLGDISFAEEAVQEAFAIALAKWPSNGIPPSPVGWLITTARNRALDRLRREASRSERQHAAQLLNDVEQAEEHDVHDDHLRLIFTCCHPALAPDAQVALTLRLIGGLSTEEIAHAFLLQPTSWHSAYPAPKPKSATPISRIAFRRRPSYRPACTQFWRWSI
jgi:RNA polymerase sigma-70 factor (ECF subfamily)